jgi:hypothetical protein
MLVGNNEVRPADANPLIKFLRSIFLSFIDCKDKELIEKKTYLGNNIAADPKGILSQSCLPDITPSRLRRTPPDTRGEL